jgi:hypothetical protein
MNSTKRLETTNIKKRAADAESLRKPFKQTYEPRMLSEAERQREPIKNSVLLAQFQCVHGVPYLFRDTRMGCKRCGSYSNKAYSTKTT